MIESFPTPLGPLITTIKGLGVGANGSELNDEPTDVSRARYKSIRSAVSTAGIGTAAGLRDSAMLEIDLGVREFGVRGVNWLKRKRGVVGFLVRESGLWLKWGIEAQNLRISIELKRGSILRYVKKGFLNFVR